MKKYNNSTGCYKIDVYYNSVYLFSTDRFKTCKSAKEHFLIVLNNENLSYKPEKISCKFYHY